MEKLKLIMMIVSLVGVLCCFAVSLYCVTAFKGDSFFYFATFFFGAATVWMGVNVYNLFKSKQ